MRFNCLLLLRLNVLFTAAACSQAAFIMNPALLNTNDSVSWSQLGNPGAPVLPSLDATSLNGINLVVSLTGSAGGTAGEVCPAGNCNYSAGPGFNAGDHLLWTEDSFGNGTGPLNIAFSTPVEGVGFYLQLTAPGTFVASFTEIAAGHNTTEYLASDSNGDPLFVGAVDSIPDLTGIAVAIQSCVPASPGGCDVSDFAIDRLDLATAVPEPATFIPVFGALLLLAFCFRPSGIGPQWKAMKRGIVCAACLTASAGLIEAQDAPALPIWNYEIVSPLDGLSYRGYMVGTSPFNRGARTTTVPVLLVPFIVTFRNTTSGFTTTFDPSTAPDPGCTANQTVMSLVENSPIFQPRDWTLNGVYVGNTQYIDAFQRANFWQYVQNTGNAYHTILSYTLAPPLPLTVSYAAPALSGEVRTGVEGNCTNPGCSGSTNAGAYDGIVDMNVMYNAMTNYIATHGITPDQFPIFILYNVMYSENNQTLFLGGYHFTGASYPRVLQSPGQTFAVANFRTNGIQPFDVSILSHEIAEWMNDPGGNNPVPLWGNIGEVSGCKHALEVGDPLTGTDLPAIVGSNGFAYHLQELAFFSWFFRTPSIGAGGLYSDNGTFALDAGAACQ
jgi:hypothetical protein